MLRQSYDATSSAKFRVATWNYIDILETKIEIHESLIDSCEADSVRRLLVNKRDSLAGDLERAKIIDQNLHMIRSLD